MIKIQGLKLLKNKSFTDNRGYFCEQYKHSNSLALGIEAEYLQDNLSFSKFRGTMRGLHYQRPPSAQAKLVSCVSGAVFDVAVDIRRGSETYGEWFGVELSPENRNQLFIPVGFAHGFVTLMDNTILTYKCSSEYDPQTEGALLWSDEKLGIKWPKFEHYILSEKDAVAEFFDDFVSPFAHGENS